ncbi:hypothetical protein LTS09_009203 [Friedmanniomyces endolithicus]|nr:hypothetical protein LTS09_009203 [Friedmanniomyces endolithicus]
MNGTTNGHLPTKQRAAQFHPKDKSVHINEIPIPSIKPDEILVKVRAASLCHSDLMLFEPNEQGLVLGEGDPFTMGHEACGTVVEVGAEAKRFKKGDKLGWLPIVDCCFDCEECQIHNLYCERGESKVQGMTVDGYFQEYCAIKWRNAVHIPDDMDLDTCAPLFCAGCTAFNAVTDTLAELPGEPNSTWVAVIGCGGLGHLAIQYLKAYGYRVVGIDLSAEALAEAKTSGGDHVFNPKADADYIRQVREITGKGCHAAINVTNSVPAYSSTPQLLRMNGGVDGDGDSAESVAVPGDGYLDESDSDKKDFDLSALGGPKTIHEQRWLPPSISNTTFTIDLCSPLKKLKGVDSKEQCPSGTRVCGVEERYNPIDGVKEVVEVRPIAGEFSTSHGRAMDPEVTRLKESSNTALEGLRIELRGGKFPETRSGDLQKAIVELLCDRELTGNEGFEEDEKVVEAASYGRMGRRADGDNDDEEPELPDLDKGKSLQFVSYKSEKDDVGVLRLTWKTKYACESAEKEPAKEPTEGNKTAGWGFFTWFIIVVFLLIAAYIIFGSWLNYSRYGARGWDLIPHGDTLRDLPYLMKEWVGGLADRMKSGGSRGGYSAV